MELNIEYKDKRASKRLKELRLSCLNKGSHEIFRKWRIQNGVRESQYKPVYLTDEKKIFNEYLKVAQVPC